MNGMERVLAVNVGSSSLKLDVRELGVAAPLIKLEVRGIGRARGVLVENGVEVSEQVFADHDAAFTALAARLPEPRRLTRIGHRIVHGGPRYRATTWITAAVLGELEALVPLSPLHLPPALAVVRASRARFPEPPHAAVFDTAFHSTLPARAYTYAIPAAWRDAGIRRYGFHGIACADVVAQLGTALRPRAVLLHLGAGCSATALRDGVSIDTTMGLTPLEGLVMASRSGDLDPGALLYAQRALGLSVDEVERALNQASGLLGVSECSANMRSVLQRQDDPRAALAVELFCYRAAKTVGALTVALGGLDQLIFSGGIGEHAGAIRARIMAQLALLGLRAADPAQGGDDGVISAPLSAVEARIVRVDEGRAIAAEAAGLSLPSH